MFQVIQTADLTGRMATQGQVEFFTGDAASVITYLQPAQTTLLNIYPDMRGPCIETVFDQLFDH